MRSAHETQVFKKTSLYVEIRKSGKLSCLGAGSVDEAKRVRQPYFWGSVANHSDVTTTSLTLNTELVGHT
jgi:TATA-box binding protein (TBP) (component of TFIID and TFIIIB)